MQNILQHLTTISNCAMLVHQIKHVWDIHRYCVSKMRDQRHTTFQLSSFQCIPWPRKSFNILPGGFIRRGYLGQKWGCPTCWCDMRWRNKGLVIGLFKTTTKWLVALGNHPRCIQIWAWKKKWNQPASLQKNAANICNTLFTSIYIQCIRPSSTPNSPHCRWSLSMTRCDQSWKRVLPPGLCKVPWSWLLRFLVENWDQQEMPGPGGNRPTKTSLIWIYLDLEMIIETYKYVRSISLQGFSQRLQGRAGTEKNAKIM